MKKWFWILISLIALVGCSASSTNNGSTQAAASDPAIPPIVNSANAGNVIVEGTVEPVLWRNLSFTIPGEVDQVWVKTGDVVQAGAPLIQLDTSKLQVSLQSAEQDVIAQEAALQELLTGASDKVIARADKGNTDQIAQAEVVLAIKQLQLEKAQAEDPALGVAAAQAAINQLQLRLAQTRAQDPTPAVTGAEVTLERARIALEDTQDEYNKAVDRPWEDQEIRDAWAKRLEQAQLDYKAAQAQLESALNSQKAHELGLGVLAAQIQEAQTQLSQAITAQETYSITLRILDAEAKAAELNLEALRTWDNPYRDDPSDEQIAQARALVEKTKLAVEMLRLQIEDAELTAPFAGTVVDVIVEVGDQVVPSQTTLVLATLDQLEVHTTDLTELDIAQVVVGQPVIMSVDAFPGTQFAGTIAEIALQGQDYRGDVVYQATITLDEPEQVPFLRWGMTTMVEIKTK